MYANVILLILAVLVGMVIPVQIGLNSILDTQLKNPFFSSFLVFLVGAGGILLSALLAPQPIPSSSLIKGSHWWSYLGGLLGAVYILSLIILSQYINIGLLSILALAGQLLMSVVVDHYGWFGSEVNPINGMKILGLLCIGLGVYLLSKF